MIEWLIKKGVFRNADHAIWFLTTVGLLLVLFMIYFGISFSTILIVVPIVVHLPPLVTSSWLAAKHRSTAFYSKNCIWFNAVMIGIYLLFWILI